MYGNGAQKDLFLCENVCVREKSLNSIIDDVEKRLVYIDHTHETIKKSPT